MTQQHADRAATVVLGVAAAAAAYYVMKTPALRRMAWGLLRTAVGTTGPAWLMAETRRGWDASATRPGSAAAL